MSRRGENIYLRKDGRWEGRYMIGRRPDGKPRYCSIYGKQYKEVKEKLIQQKAQIHQEAVGCIIYGDGSLRAWAEYWLEILVRPYVRPGTYEGYCRNLKNHINPLLGQYQINALKQEQLQAFVNELQKKLAPSTTQGICRLLKALLHSAQENKVLLNNPYCGIKLPKMHKRSPRVLSLKEQEKLENRLAESGDLEYILCLYTGLRVGEVCGLLWQDVDFENHCIHISHSIHRISSKSNAQKSYLSLEAPKSECSIREIPIPAFLAELLESYKSLRGGTLQAPIFPGTKGQYQDPRTMQQRLGRLCKELALKKVHMHTLRHTFATRCLERGIRYEVLSEFLGHSSPQITLRHYVHCTPDAKRESMERMQPTLPLNFKPSKMVSS